jgi:hypothetical protein
MFKIFEDTNISAKNRIYSELVNIINQQTNVIKNNYIPMFKSLGIIDDDFNLTKPFGERIADVEGLEDKQFELLYELFHRKWFVFSLFHFYSIERKHSDLSKKELITQLMNILARNGFYVKSKRGSRNNPNKHRTDGFINLLYYTGIIEKNNQIQNEVLSRFEKFLKKKMSEESDERSLKSFLIDNLSKIVTGTTDEREKRLKKVSEKDIDAFNKKVVSEYKKLNERYVYIDDLEKFFDDPAFLAKLWLLQEEGKALLVPGRHQEVHKTYVKFGRRYSKIMLYGVH